MLKPHWPQLPSVSPDLQRTARWIFVLSNRERAHRSLRVVERHFRLDQVAAYHSEDMAERSYFGHLDPEGNSPQDRMLRLCPELIGGCRENLSMISAEPEEALAHDIVGGWMHSLGHRTNLLTATHTHMGIYLCQTGRRVYATQLFAGLDAELLESEFPIYLRATQSYSMRFRYHQASRCDVSVMVQTPNPEKWLPTGNGMYLKGAAILQPQWESVTDFRVDFEAHYGPGLYRIFIGRASTSMYNQQGIDVNVV